MRLLTVTTLLFAGAMTFLGTEEATSQSRNDPKTMQRLWFQANGQCRGSSGDDPKTHLACEEREAYSKRLNQLNWCYGKEGEAGYQNKWHRCTARSYR